MLNLFVAVSLKISKFEKNKKKVNMSSSSSSNEPQTSYTQISRRNLSNVWKYFNISEDSFICKQECNHKFSKTTSTSVLMRHLKNKHQIICKDSAEYDYIQTSFSKFNNNMQVALDKLYLNYVENSLVAFQTSDDDSLKKFLKTACPKYVLPSRQTTKNLLISDYNLKQISIKKMLENAKSKLSLTADIWTSIAQDPYIGITVHFVDFKYQYRSFTLGIEHFPHPHDGQSISNLIIEVCNF